MTGQPTYDAEAEATLDATGAAKTANDNAILATGIVVANVNNNSKIDIANTAAVNAQKDLTVKSAATSDVSTVAIAQTGDDSYVGAAVNVTEFSSGADLAVNNSLSVVGGNLDLSAMNLVVKNSAVARSKVGHTKISKALANLQSNLVAFIFNLSKLTGKFVGNLGEETGSKFKGAGAVVFTQGSHNAEVKVGKNVDLTAGKDLKLKSSAIIEDIFLNADSIARSQLTKADGNKVNVSAGIIYSDISQKSTVQIADADHEAGANKTNLVGLTVDISSEAKIEYNRINRMIQEVKDAFAVFKASFSSIDFDTIVKPFETAFDQIGSEFSNARAEDLTAPEKILSYTDSIVSLGSLITAFADAIADLGAIGAGAGRVIISAADFTAYNNFLNISVSSAIKGANEENSKDIGFSGAVGLSDFKVESETIIGRNVTLKSTNSTAGTSDSVSISADTDVEVIGAAGHLIPSSGALSFGGTYFSQDYIANADVYVAEGADLLAGVNDILVSATNNSRNVVAGFSSAMASSGVEGMVTHLTGVSGARVNIDDEVLISAKNIKFNSLNATKVVNIAGSAMITSAIGASVGAAVNDFVKESLVYFGDIDSTYQDMLDEKTGTDKTTTTDSTIERDDAKAIATENMDVQAKSSGGFTAVGVGGGVIKNDDSGETGGFFSKMSDKFKDYQDKGVNIINSVGNYFAQVNSEVENKTDAKDTKNHKNPPFSLSVAGSIALNFIENTTKTDISGATIELGEVKDKKISCLNVMAINSTNVDAGAGAAGVMWQKGTKDNQGKSVGIAGALGYNDLKNTTAVNIADSTITKVDKIKAFAVNGGANVAAGLGMQLSKNTGNAQGAYTFGGSVSVNSIDNDVKATLNNTSVIGRDLPNRTTEVNVAAYESDIQVTGGLQLTVGQQKGAFGAAVNLADIKNNVTATIDGGNYSHIKNVSVSALQALTQVNGALTAGIIMGTDDTTALMGAIIYNRLKNHLDASIKGATIDASGNVNVKSRDYNSGNTISGYESYLERVDSGLESFISIDGSDYYDVDASNDADATDGNLTTLRDQNKNGSLIVSAAMAISAADKALGAAVVINDIDEKFKSTIDGSTVNAAEINTGANADAFLVSTAGGVAVSSKTAAGGGSVVWNTINNEVSAGVQSSTLTSTKVNTTAVNDSKIIGVTGQVSAGKGSGALGMALTYNDIVNSANVFSLGSKIIGPDTASSFATIAAGNFAEILSIGASVAASEKVGISGSVSINKINNTTSAEVDNNYVDDNGDTQTIADSAITGYKNVLIKSEDGARIKSLAGTVAAGGKAGIGGAVAYNDINGASEVSVRNISLSAENAKIKTDNSATIWTLAAGIGGGSTAAIQGAAATSEIGRTISAKMDNIESIRTDSSIEVTSNSTGSINSSATVLAVGGKAAVGAGVAVNRIGDTVNASVNGGTLKLKNLEVKSKASQTIKTIGAAGSGGGSAGVSGSVAVNRIATTNTASIAGNADITAENNVGVVAQTDDNLFNYAGLLSIGGTAGVGAAVSVNHILGDTTAFINNSTVTAKGLGDGIAVNSDVSDTAMNDGFISNQSVNITYSLAGQRQTSNKKGVVVDGSATHTLKSFVANAAGAGTVGLAGTTNVSQTEGKTAAYIKDTTLNGSGSAGDLTVNAADYTNVSGFIGSVGGAGTVGIGASADASKIKRNTSASLENIKTGSRAKAVNVNSIAKQGLSSVVAGIGVSGSASVAGTVSVNLISGATEAFVKNSLMTVDSMNVTADHLAKISALNTTAAVSGYAGVGGGVAVNDIRDVVKAEVTSSTIGFNTNGSGAFAVKAANNTFLNATAASIGGGVAGVAGNVSVNYLANEVTANLLSSNIGTADTRAGNIKIEADNTTTLESNVGTVAAGVVGAGASVAVNTLDGQVRASVDGSSLYAKNDIAVLANENRNIDQYTFTAAAGAISTAGNVMIVSSGQKLATDDADGNQEILDAVSSAENVSNDDIENPNDVLSAGELTSLNSSGNNLSSQQDGKAATTVAVGKINAATGSILNSSNGAVNLKADENTSIELTGGAAAGSVNGPAAGGSVGIVNARRNVGTTVTGATITAAGDVDLKSNVQGNSNLDMYQGSVGIFTAGTAAYGRINSAGNALTNVSGTTIENSGQINIIAEDTSGANAKSYGLTIGTIAAGVLVTQVDNSGATKVNLNNIDLTSSAKSMFRQKNKTI